MVSLNLAHPVGHVNPTIFGSTAGYPSDSLASCFDSQTVFAQYCAALHRWLNRLTCCHMGTLQPDLGRGPGGPGPRPPTNRGPLTKPLNFLANDRCLPCYSNRGLWNNEKLCKLAVSLHSLVNLCIRWSRIQKHAVRCRNSSQNAQKLAIYTPKSKKILAKGPRRLDLLPTSTYFWRPWGPRPPTS